MTGPFLNFLKIFLPFALLLFGIQYTITLQLFVTTPFYYALWSVYVFHFIATVASYLFLLFVHKSFPDKAGYTFMGTGVLKMMACVIFLIPMIQSDIVNRVPDVGAFFIPYFLFLLFETMVAVRLINKV
jgi:hypothetical protein